MQRRAAEAVLLGERRQRRGRRVRRDAEDQVVIRINIALQAQFAPGGVHREVGQVEVAAAGDLVGEHLAAGQAEFCEDAVAQALVKSVVGDALDGQLGIGQKSVILHAVRVLEVDQHGDPLAGRRRKNGAQQPRQAERRKGGGLVLR